MLATNHVLAGALTAVSVPDRRLAIPAAAASHLLLDTIAHYGQPDRDRYFAVARIDGLTAAGVTAGLAALAARRGGPRLAWLVAAGALAGVAADIDKPALYFFGRTVLPRRVAKALAVVQTEHVDRLGQEVAVAALLAAALAVVVTARYPARLPQRPLFSRRGIRRRGHPHRGGIPGTKRHL